MHLAHAFIGKFDLPVPLPVVLAGAVVVVAASFVLVYALPDRRPEARRGGAVVPRWAVVALQALALAFVGFLLGVGLLGRQTNVLNPAVLAFWVATIPLLPLAHALVGGEYEVANPFALIARLLTSGASARARRHPLLDRLGYWPAVAQLLVLVFLELAFPPVPNSPQALAALVAFYTGFQVAMGIFLGEQWYRTGDLWQALTTMAGTIAPVALVRDDDGYVRLRIGFRADRAIPVGRGREALVTLWLAGVLADGVRTTPIWRAFAQATQAVSDSVGQAGDINLGEVGLDTAEILATWLAFAAFFWLFTYVAAALSGRDAGGLAGVVSPSLVPIALAYLLAHNLTQLLVIAPLMFSSPADVATAAAELQRNVAGVRPAIVFAVQVTAIVLGHVLAVLMAHAGIAAVEKEPGRRLRADLGWLAAMLVYTATSLWVLAQPLANQA
ncbi:MAG: hypothetical protein QOE92_2393 [Chloroflexota bacterium]|jgi:hypothetical protein|nr:hypothetical protein [Chloroflexota bacterium]